MVEKTTEKVMIFWTKEKEQMKKIDLIEGDRINLKTEVILFTPDGENACKDKTPKDFVYHY